MKIDIIAGARPNFMKIAPIIEAIQAKQLTKKHLHFRLIHTGQHYDEKMSGDFFKQLQIPQPDFNLNIGSGTQAQQTGAIMVRYEELLLNKNVDICIVVGDVNSTMACSIVAKKMGLIVVHIEGGIRSFDLTMPEEINRMVTDSITDYFYTTSKHANENLFKMGIPKTNIIFVGNTMIDTLIKNLPKLIQPSIFNELELKSNNYFLLTMHRPANVDSLNTLKQFLVTIDINVQNLKVLFPVHPRTKSILKDLNIKLNNIHFLDPLPYLEFNFLLKNSKCVITDSGGITEEATYLNIPCMTLRDNTERPETIEVGSNELIGTNPEKIPAMLNKIFDNKWKKSSIPELWDGKTAKRIVDHILKIK